MAEDLKRQYTGKIPRATIKWLERRSEAFQLATSSKRGRPADGVTYGSGKEPKGGSR